MDRRQAGSGIGRPGAPGRLRPAAGFTLIEMLTAMAILVIVMTFAVPGLTSLQRGAELTSNANTLLSSLTVARAEAMKRGRNVTVTPADGSNWNSGWIVFVDDDASGTKGDAETTLSSEPAPPGTISIATDPAGIAYLMFNGSGYPRLTNGAFQASSMDLTHALSGDKRRIVSSPAGRLRICKPDASTCATDVL